MMLGGVDNRWVEAIQLRIKQDSGWEATVATKGAKETKVTQSVFSHSSRGGSISPIRLEADGAGVAFRRSCRHMECGERWLDPPYVNYSSPGLCARHMK